MYATSRCFLPPLIFYKVKWRNKLLFCSCYTTHMVQYQNIFIPKLIASLLVVMDSRWTIKHVSQLWSEKALPFCRITFNTRLITRLPQIRKTSKLSAKILWTKLISFEIWRALTGIDEAAQVSCDVTLRQVANSDTSKEHSEITVMVN